MNTSMAHHDYCKGESRGEPSQALKNVFIPSIGEISQRSIRHQAFSGNGGYNIAQPKQAFAAYLQFLDDIVCL